MPKSVRSESELKVDIHELDRPKSPIISPIIKQKNKIEMDINTLFKFIKPYNGNRECLNSFIINCNNAIELASEIQRPILLKFILCQLEGKAELACSIKEFNTWEQLKDFLKTQFSDRKHYSHLLTVLQESRQGQTESVNSYALKIETCLSQLLTEISLSNHKLSEIPGRTAAMEDLALHHFIMGLKPNLSLTLRCKSPKNLNEAINIAICEERIMQSVYKNRSAISTFNSSTNNYQSKESFSKSNPRPSSQRTDRPTDHRNFVPGNLICRYCKAVGHTIEKCRKREFNNRNRPSNSFTPQSRVNHVTETDDYGRDEVDDSKN